MSTPLATFFTKIGFDIDTKSIAALDRSLARLETRISSLSNSLQGMSSNKTLNAAAKLANAEARKMVAESGILRQQLGLAKVQADTEKIKQRTISQGQTLEAVKIRSAAASVKAQETLATIAARQRLKETPSAGRVSSPHSPDRRGGGGGGGIAGMGINAQTAITAIASGGLVQSAYQVANFSTARQPQYEFLTGSKEEGAKQMAFLDSEVKRLSLDLMDADKQYKQLLASGTTSIGLEKTQQLFTNFSNISTMLGMSADAQKRGVNALGQMMS